MDDGKWKEADEETLEVMLQVANRPQQGYLNSEDIEKFPCEDLRIIDQLWVKYSITKEYPEGKFGFSVQKKIYESLGGTREYNKEVWENFCTEIGWRQGDKYLNYSDQTGLLAREGHLPRWATVTMAIKFYRDQKRRGPRNRGSYLFSRAKTCNL